MAYKKKADYQEGLEKNRADCSARSSKVNKNDLEKSSDASAARSRESYLKDPEKNHARNCESYMKDPEKSRGDSAARSRKS